MATSSRICDKCGYELLGLPATGRCPECGNPYSAVEGVGLVRHSEGLRSRQRLRRLRTVGLAFLALTAFGCSGLLSLVAAHPERAWGMGVFLAVMLLLCSLCSYVYEKD